MSEEKLKLPQKMFAALERLIRETRVRELDLDYRVTAKTTDISMKTAVKPIAFALPATVTDIPVTITTQSIEILSQFIHPDIFDSSLESLTTAVVDEQVESINTTAVVEEPLEFSATTRVIDLFRQYRIDPRRLSSYIQSDSSKPSRLTSLIRQVDFQLLKPGVHTLHQNKLKISAEIKENTVLFKRLTTQKKAVILSYLSEQEQLIYWRQAVLQTKKEPRQLQLIGVFTGIPYDYVENIKVNYRQKSLNYNFKVKSTPGKRSIQLKDIALFSDITTNKIIMVFK